MFMMTRVGVMTSVSACSHVGVMTSVSACSRVKLQFIHRLLLLLMLAMCSLARNSFYNFSNCKSPSATVVIDGATVISQSQPYYSRHNTSCGVTFQARQSSQTILLQFTHLDVKKGSKCIDYITIITLYNKTYEDIILDKFCGDLSHLTAGHHIYSSGNMLYIEWTTGPEPDTNNRGFNLTLTALTQLPVVCDSKTSQRCRNNDCINASLLCDGVAHCLTGEDEDNCQHKATDPPYSIQPHPSSKANRPRSTPSTSKAPFKEEVYLWLPLIVVVLFTVIMVTLILIGRKSGGHGYTSQLSRTDFLQSLNSSVESSSTYGSVYTTSTTTVTTTTTTKRTTTTTHKPGADFDRADVISITVVMVLVLLVIIICVILAMRERRMRSSNTEDVALTDDQNSLRLDLNSNPGFVDSEGVPETPPPTYSMIERQTSYVSHISQSSSQLEVPPGYDEAVDLPGTQNGQVRSAAPSRQNSSGSLSRRMNPRSRIFSRSISASEPPVRSMRYIARSSSTSDHTGNMESILETSHSERHRSDSDHSDVFLEIIPQSPDSQSREQTDTASGSQPVTSTPHRPTTTDCSVEFGRSDSALLGDVSDNTDSSFPVGTESSTNASEIRFF